MKSRLVSTEGLSFTEFTYQALQAHDWAHLHATKRCLVQLGGSDQLGNMVAGQEVLQGEQCWGVLLPLITDEAGNKFGKSAGVDISLGLTFLNNWFPMQVLRFGWISPKLRCLNFTNSLFASPMPWLDLSCASSLSSLIKKWRRWRRNIERNLSCVLAKLPLHSRWTILWSKGGMPGSGNFSPYLSFIFCIGFQNPLQVTLLVHGEEGLRIAERTTSVLYKQDLKTLSQLNVDEARQIFHGAPYLR